MLAALGVNIDAAPETISRCICECGLGFMFAPAHHAAMRHVAQVRSELGTRTIFNLLGPLANPAGTKYQLVGVFAPQWVEPIAQVLALLGTERAWVVHGGDGLDELTDHRRQRCRRARWRPHLDLQDLAEERRIARGDGLRI